MIEPGTYMTADMRGCYCRRGCSACQQCDTRTPDAVLADRLATALRRVLRTHETDLNWVVGVECRVPRGSALEQAADAVCDWADARGVEDDPDLSPWRRW